MVTIEPIELTAMSAADPASAWEALTDPKVVARWFAEVSPAAPVGAPYSIDFGDGSGVQGVVREHEPGRRLAYTWTWRGQPDGETVVSWSVQAEPEGGSRITLVHSGWTEAGADAATRDDHRSYWEMYLTGLVSLLDEVAATTGTLRP